MNNIETIKEEIDVNTTTATVEIPVRVTMTSYMNAPFDFDASIDEVGQIVLTPTSKDVEFIDANTDSTVDYEIPVAEQETVETTDGSITEKTTSIIVTATLLARSKDANFSADIDEIGQCIIYPMGTDDVFLTVSINNSLNIVTEELKTENYFGYTFTNNGDGWDIKDTEGNVIEEGVATLPEAKILVLETELSKLKRNLTESVEAEDQPESDDNKQEEPEKTENPEETKEVPEVTAKVVIESVDSIKNKLTDLTNNFSDDKGIIRCDTEEELEACSEILRDHYNEVLSCNNNGLFTVSYSSAEVNDNVRDNMDIIVRFLQGELDSITVEGTPNAEYIHIEELDTDDCEYYYDPESDSLGCYTKENI